MDEIEKIEKRALAIRSDVVSRIKVDKAVMVDILVNNAATENLACFEEATEKEVDRFVQHICQGGLELHEGLLSIFENMGEGYKPRLASRHSRVYRRCSIRCRQRSCSWISKTPLLRMDSIQYQHYCYMLHFT